MTVGAPTAKVYSKTRRLPRAPRAHRRRVLLVLPLILLLYGAYTLVIVYRAGVFRRHPEREVAIRLVQGEWPHNVIARILLFKPGSIGYNNDLRFWVYSSVNLSDNPWNRWILEKDVARMSEDELTIHLPHYPLRPTPALMPYIRAILNSRKSGSYKILLLLGRIGNPEANAEYSKWIQEAVVNRRSGDAFVQSIEYIVQSPLVAPLPLFEAIWPNLSDKQRRLVIYRTARSLQSEGPVASGLFEWFKGALAGGKIKTSSATARLVGRFLTFKTLREAAIGLIVQESKRLKPTQAAHLLHYLRTGQLEDPAKQASALKEVAQIEEVLFERLRSKNAQLACDILSALADIDSNAAERTAASILAGPDSELRKGAIVVLVNHASPAGLARIDDAFRGLALRRTMFDNINGYIYGSKASETYRALARHDYWETGKTWPPTYLKGPPVPQEVDQWKEFIRDYPWFPGTDDAYYRLAYSQHRFGDSAASVQTIREFLSRKNWPDADARPYVLHLLRSLVTSDDLTGAASPDLQHLRTIVLSPLGQLIFDPQPDVIPLIDAIDWFLSHPSSIEILNTNEKTLKLMRQVAKIVQTSPANQRLGRVATTLLESRRAYSRVRSAAEPGENARDPYANEDGYGRDEAAVIKEDEEASIHTIDDASREMISGVLYAKFFTPNRPAKSGIYESVPDDPSEKAMLGAASRLSESLSTPEGLQLRGFPYSELILWTLLHCDDEFRDSTSTANFLPAFTAAARVDPRTVPSTFQGLYQKLVGLVRR